MQIHTLIVDDSKAMLGVMRATLEELGIRKNDCVQSGEEALSLIKKNPNKYQLVFVDLNMPGIDGMEVIRVLASMRFAGGVVIISELNDKIIKLAVDVTRTQRVRLLGSINKPISAEKTFPILQKMKTLHQLNDNRPKQLTKEQIRNAILQDRIVPYFQPMVDNKTGQVSSLEVLARIKLPGVTDAVTADRFISVAEENNLILKITEKMLEAALRDYSRVADEFGKDCALSINISPIDLNDAKLPEMLLGKIKHHGVDSSKLVLEVTESCAIDNALQLETLSRLRIKGMIIALDDFGTGYTNIHQLKNLPVNKIKIDRSLIFNIAEDRLAQVIVHSLLDIFEELDVNVIAEGIEQPADLDYMNNLPIPLLLQGYIVSKPKAIGEICRWHHSWKKTVSA